MTTNALGVSVRQRGDGRKVKRAVERAASAVKRSVPAVSIGFYATAKYQDGTPVTIVAAAQEFGTKDKSGKQLIPSRPYFRNSLKDFPDIINEILRAYVDPAAPRVTPQMAGLIGVAGASRIQREIVKLRQPPNSPATIKRKKSSNPLIDTGKLRQSVSWRIEWDDDDGNTYVA